MKPMMITLLYLYTLVETSRWIRLRCTGETCESWFHHNVKVHEKKRKMFSNLYYHEYKGKQVIGYICGDEPPQ
jgi:hypothetical protein